MVFSDKDLIFSGIHSDTSNPSYIISVFDTKIHDHTLGLMIQPF